MLNRADAALRYSNSCIYIDKELVRVDDILSSDDGNPLFVGYNITKGKNYREEITDEDRISYSVPELGYRNVKGKNYAVFIKQNNIRIHRKGYNVDNNSVIPVVSGPLQDKINHLARNSVPLIESLYSPSFPSINEMLKLLSEKYYSVSFSNRFAVLHTLLYEKYLLEYKGITCGVVSMDGDIELFPEFRPLLESLQKDSNNYERIVVL